MKMHSSILTEMEPRWRVVRARPKSEHVAAQFLSSAGFETFCPRIRHQKATQRGRVWFVEALFPSYLFVKFAYAPHARLVQSSTGVSGLLGFNEGGIVSEGAIAELQSGFAEPNQTLTLQVGFSIGEEVEIVQGPMRGAQGIVTRLMPSRERVCILLEFLGGLQEIEVPLLSLLGLRDARQGLISAA